MEEIKQVLQEVQKVMVGKKEIVEKVMMVILAKGHILLEDMPGVGKTTLATAFAQAMALEHRRMQFTIDVLPSDVVGYTMMDAKSGELRLCKGAIFTNIFLADEINRTSSRTQAALLEVMEEQTITIDGYTQQAWNPFLVIATQNPYGSAGTALLPESQLDRFMVRLQIGYPLLADEIEILHRQPKLGNDVQAVISKVTLLDLQCQCEQVYVHDSLYTYIVQLIHMTRRHPDIVRGASPRASLSLLAMAKACALVKGRDFVVPEDVQYVFQDTIAHRILMREGKDAHQVLQEIATQVDVPHEKK